MSNPRRGRRGGMLRLPRFALEAYFSRFEFVARYNMAASHAQTMSIRELLALGSAADRRLWPDVELGYIETWGSPALRTAIAGTYETLASSDVLCFAGAEEGLWCAMHALLGPADHAIVTVPNYQSMESVPLALCQVTGVALRASAGWQLDLDAVRAALRPETKLIALNVPNNPTGALLSRSTLADLIALAAERRLYVFSDEVYRGLERAGAERLPAVADLYDRGLSLGVVSKAYGLPGLRVGWIATRSAAVLRRMERFKHYLSICNSGPSEYLARVAIDARAPILQRNRALCDANLVRLERFFSAFADRYEWYRPAGGCVGFARYTGADGVEAHCRRLIEEAGVLLLPASTFRSELLDVDADRFRVGFGKADFALGLDAWRDALTSFDDAHRRPAATK